MITVGVVPRKSEAFVILNKMYQQFLYPITKTTIPKVDNLSYLTSPWAAASLLEISSN
jgi:hypothetical protein